MSRFIVVDLEEAKQYDKDEWYTDGVSEYDERDFLVDTKKKEIVFADGGETEDMILRRDLRTFVDLLNEVAEE